MGNEENAIEWMKGNKTATLSLTSQKHINKVKKLAEEYPDECDCHINVDGSAYAHVPLSYVKISHPRQMSDEQKQAASDRLKNLKSKTS